MARVPYWPADGALRDLAAMTDPVGVLSVYVDADPARQAANRPPWAIAVEDAAAAIVSGLREDGARERWVAVRDALSELDPEITRMARGAEAGRARVLFAPVSSPGSTWRLHAQPATRTGMTLGAGPFLGPLLELRERGRPVGVVAVTRSGLDVHDHRMGALTHLRSETFDVDDADWREMKGPAAANPASAQQTAPQRDRFQRRVSEWRQRFLEDRGSRIADLPEAADWGAVAIVGDPRLTGLVAGDRAPGIPTVTVDATGDGRQEGVFTAAADHARSHALAEVARRFSEAQGAGATASGVGPVRALAREGRVRHLLLAAGRDPGGIPPTAPDESVIVEAIGHGAEVSVIDPGSGGDLGDEGVAALLRW